MTDYLAIDRLEKRFTSHGRAAFKDITFSVRQGEFVALIGPSGCGKSTLLHIMAGLSAADGGTVRLNGDGHRWSALRNDVRVPAIHQVDLPVEDGAR